MKNLFLFALLLAFPYCIYSQDQIKHYIEIESGFVTLSSTITAIDLKNDIVYIKLGKNNILKMKNSEMNKEFIDYISPEDMIVLSYEGDTGKITIIKQIESKVKVKIYYNVRKE